MSNPEHSIPEKEFDFKMTEAEYRTAVEALLELPGKYTYSLIKKLEASMVEQQKALRNGDSDPR